MTLYCVPAFDCLNILNYFVIKKEKKKCSIGENKTASLLSAHEFGVVIWNVGEGGDHRHGLIKEGNLMRLPCIWSCVRSVLHNCSFTSHVRSR